VSPHFTFRVPFYAWDRSLERGGSRQANGADEQPFAIAAFNGVDGLIEADRFLGVLVEFDLVVAGNQPGEADAHEADQQAAIVESFEELVGGLQEEMVGVGVVDGLLFYYGVEVGIAEFDGEAAGEFVLFAELEGDRFGHPNQFGVEEVQVDGIGFECSFGGDGLLFAVGDDG